MTVSDIAHIIEEWAPKWIAWERDNVGLQVGDASRTIKKVLVALDVTEQIAAEAVAKKVDLIISHHPLLFRPAAAITAADDIGRIILKLVEKKIAVYSAHTNLDFTRDGVSFILAKKLELRNIRFLSPLHGLLAKIAVFVPPSHVDEVANAMAKAGAGMIGEYTSCSFRLQGTGTFRGSEKTHPFFGKPGQLEQAEEVRLEMIAPRARTAAIVAAMKEAHPYEEVAYDIYPLENSDPNYGMGAIGELKKLQSLKSFLTWIKKSLNAEGLRYTGNPDRLVKKVAVCGGSGSDLLRAVLDEGADVFVTSDVRYHTFHTAAHRIALIDAGHWETEHGILEPLAERLRQAAKIRGRRLSVLVTQHSTNPMHYG